MVTCQDAHRLIADAIDQMPPPADLPPALRWHLASCDRCREELETQQDVRHLLASEVDESLPPGFAARLAARLAQEPAPGSAPLEEVSSPAARHAWSVMEAASPEPARWRVWGLRLLPLAATVAVVVVAEGLRPPTPPSATPSATTAPAADPTTARAGSDARRRAPGATTDDERHAGTGRPEGRGAAPAAVARVAGGAAGQAPQPSVPATETMFPLPATDTSGLGIVLAPELAQDLKLSDTQRKRIAEIYDTRRAAVTEILERTRQRVEHERSQTDAAIEKVLTPEQRNRYREWSASQTPSARPVPGQPPIPPSPLQPQPVQPQPLQPQIQPPLIQSPPLHLGLPPSLQPLIAQPLPPGQNPPRFY